MTKIAFSPITYVINEKTSWFFTVRGACASLLNCYFLLLPNFLYVRQDFST